MTEKPAPGDTTRRFTYDISWFAVQSTFKTDHRLPRPKR